MEERDYKFTLEKKLEMQEVLMEQKQLPDLPEEIDHVSYLDGSKVYFKNGGWVIAPLLRHGAAAAHFLRDAGCRRGGGHLHQIRAVP